MANKQWTIKINKMNGSILIGFCSCMHVNSIDYIINKYGELKRKDLNESKYRIIKKDQAFHFETGDIIKFQYKSLKRVIKIFNETKRLDMEMGMNELDEIGDKVYTFYSMETLNDSIVFL